MAKIVFISLYDQAAYGIRILSACLKKAGHERHIIFLKAYVHETPRSRTKLYEGEIPWQGIGPLGKPFVYAVGRDITETEKRLLIETLKRLKPDCIGMTVNTPLKQRAIAVAELIRAELPSVPLVWGGFEPTINPEGSLRYCDIACRGEAEPTILDLARAIDGKGSFRDIGNLCFKENGSVVRNVLYPPIEALDALPFQDCEPAGNFFIEGDRIEENPRSLYQLDGFFSTISGRGCIYQCSYCCERYLKDLYKPHPFLRRRSPENVVSELEEVKAGNDVRYVMFQDEVFSHQIDWLERFVVLYKERIGLPFTAYVVPSPDFEYKIKLLKNAGLNHTCLAVQTGSPRINKLYKRSFNEELTLKAADILKRLDLIFYTDVISYNPFEEVEDLEQTLHTLLKLPQPYDICINKLYVTPGTELSEQIKSTYLDKARTGVFDYYSALFWISSYFRCSRMIVDVIKSIPFFRSRPAWLKPLLYVLSSLGFINRNINKMKRLKRAGKLNYRLIITYAQDRGLFPRAKRGKRPETLP